jgi:predicted nucleotidyltransferase
VVRAPELDFSALLKVLTRHEVDFIIVGGVGAVLQGAPLSTFDIDLVHSLEPGNVDRLLEALDSLGARYRGRPGAAVAPDRSHLSSPGHQLLMTDAGPLDLLGAIGKGRRFEELVDSTVELEIEDGLRVRVLDLETLIEIKEETGREKDRAVLPLLRRTLEERRKR